MGIIYSGVPKELALDIKNLYGINDFIETGTFYGKTTVWAAKNFNKVHTIEFSKELYSETSNKYKDISNINFIYGDSKVELGKIVEKLDKSALIWLDAHYCGGSTHNDSCPLKDELEVINKLDKNHFILIDDARFILSPYTGESYGELVDIINILAYGGRYVVVIEDVVIGVPRKAKKLIDEYCRKVTDRQIRELGKKNRLRNLAVKVKRMIKI